MSPSSQGGGDKSDEHTTGPKPFERRILPVSDCAPKILAQFPASLMIPIDQGGGGYTPQRIPERQKTNSTAFP
jgi:hypothetical protein